MKPSREDVLNTFLKCKRVCTDTRNITSGALFICLKGDNFDGNTFAQKALDLGAASVIIDNPKYLNEASGNMILVEDSLIALQNLALDYRNSLTIPVIGITGTNGKTTTKELMQAVLEKHYSAYATAGNYNNHIGVPLSVLEIKKEHEIAIIEMGANKGADIIELAEIARPTHGLITNVGKAHLEGFGSFENIKKTKKELYDFLGNNDGLIFINRDNHHLLEMASAYSNRSYYSIETEGTEVRGEVTNHSVNLCFKYYTKESVSEEIRTNLTGGYNLENATAAVALAKYFNVPDSKIKEGLEAYSPKNNRSQIKKTEKNTLILDAYNANITSTREALKNLAQIKNTGADTYFILGDMLELGEVSQEEHLKMIRYSEELGLKGIFVGAEYLKAANTLKHNSFKDTSDLIEHIDQMNLLNKTILIKGSRGIKLEVLEPYL